MRQIRCAGRMSLVVAACGLLLVACGGSGGGNSEGRLQAINFQYPGGGTLLDEPTTLHATATSGMAVTFKSGTPDTCTVSGDQLTLVAAGECLVIASQDGGKTEDGVQWAAADDTSQLFVVLKHAQMAVLPVAAVMKSTSETVTLSATTDAGQPATYVSNAPSVCTASGTTLSLKGLGLCELTVTAPTNESYGELNATAFIVVDSAPPFVVSTAGGVQTVALGTKDANGQALSYVSNTPSVCAVAGRELRLLAKGSCQFDMTIAGGGSESFTIGVDPRFYASGFNSTLSRTAENGEVSLAAGSALDGWCGGKTPSWCNVSMATDLNGFSPWVTGAYDIKPLVPDDSNWGEDSSIAWSYYGFQIGAPRTPVLKPDGTLDRYDLLPFELKTETSMFVAYGLDPQLYALGAKVFVRIQTSHAVTKPDGGECFVTVSQLSQPKSAAPAGYMLQLENFAVTENCGLADMPKTEGWMFDWGVTAESKAAALAELRAHSVRLLEFSPNSMNLTVSASKADGTVPAKTDPAYTLTNEITVFSPITVQ